MAPFTPAALAALPTTPNLAAAAFVPWADVPRPLDLYAIAAHALDEVRGSNYRIGAGARLTGLGPGEPLPYTKPSPNTTYLQSPTHTTSRSRRSCAQTPRSRDTFGAAGWGAPSSPSSMARCAAIWSPPSLCARVRYRIAADSHLSLTPHLLCEPLKPLIDVYLCRVAVLGISQNIHPCTSI